MGASNGRTYAGAIDCGAAATGISASIIGGTDSGVSCTREPSGAVGNRPKAVNGHTMPNTGPTGEGIAVATADGGKGWRVAQYLKQEGLEVGNLAGGMFAWELAGLPVER